MISRSGGRVPAGVTGVAGRGTVGTVAPAGRLSPLVRVTSVVYALVGIAIAVVAVVLAPWGLLLLVLSLAVLVVAFLLWLMAEGFAAIEGDES